VTLSDAAFRANSNPGAPDEIAVRRLSVRFSDGKRDFVALDDIDLGVGRNEFVCVMGPSGCGKTTLLNVIAGIVPPTSGTVQVGGQDVKGPGPDRTVVFQADAVFPWLSVEDNIAYSLRRRRLPADEIRRTVDHYLSLVGLTAFRGAWPRQLSGGMKKRVDIARAYAADPKVLLMDEPFGALDIMTKERLQEELNKLWTLAPRTVFFITHDLEEALFLGDRVILMSPRPGRIAAEYRPNLGPDRDMSVKTSPAFVELARELRQALRGFHDADNEHR
jgi:NitT/TauT family transport system ATP-binding protein